MKHIIVLHDAFTNPTQYWYPKITAMAPAGYSVITPELPTGAEQGMEHWIESLKEYNNLITKDTIIISHGISSLLTLRWVEHFSNPIRMLVSIAGCSETPAHKAFAPIAESFLTTPINWEILQKNISSVFHIWNTQDPFVSKELSRHFSELLPGKQRELTGTGHFTDIQESELFSEIQTIFSQVATADRERELGERLVQEQQQKETIVASILPTVTTYDSDVAKSVAGYQGSVISELLSEARAKEETQREQSVKNPKNVFYTFSAIVLVLIGFGLIGYGIIPKIPSKPVVQKSVIEKYQSRLLKTESVEPLELSGKELYLLLGDLQAKSEVSLSEKSFLRIIPVRVGLEASMAQFAESISLRLPVGFAGKINDFVYGFYEPLDGERVPFLLVQFDGYDVMYSIMRNWEKDILHDLEPLFAPSGTIQGKLVRTDTVEFTDDLVKNVPVRVGKTSEKIISYGFLSDTTLLITTDPGIAEPVLRRMIGR